MSWRVVVGLLRVMRPELPPGACGAVVHDDVLPIHSQAAAVIAIDREGVFAGRVHHERGGDLYREVVATSSRESDVAGREVAIVAVGEIDRGVAALRRWSVPAFCPPRTEMALPR
jgi:hypothetical protein